MFSRQPVRCPRLGYPYQIFRALNSLLTYLLTIAACDVVLHDWLHGVRLSIVTLNRHRLVAMS